MSNANSVSDLERAEHLAYEDSKGVKRVSVFNDGTQVNVATEAKQDDIIGNYTSRIYTGGGYSYICEAAIGSATSASVWRVSRVDSSGTELFADSNSNFDNVADDYATLTYG